MGLHSLEENIGQLEPGLCRALDVKLERVVLFRFLSFFSRHTLRTLRIIFHILFSQISLKSNQDLGAVAWPKSDELVTPLVVG